MVWTVAQCWLDFKGFVNVPGYVNHHDSPLAALILSATVVGIIIHAMLNVLITFRYIMTCSNEAQREAYQKCILECYYCTTVLGNSLIFQRKVLVLIYM